MALPAGLAAMGSFKGPKGNTGVLATLGVELLPWDAEPYGEMTGPEAHRGAIVHIPMPLPGPETVNNDDATELLLLNPTKTQAATVGLIDEATAAVVNRIDEATKPAMATEAIEVFGHSYTVSPSPHATPGHEFFKLLAAKAGAASVTTFGVSSGRAVQTFLDMQARGPGSAVHGTRLFIIDSEANDFANKDASGNYYNPYAAGIARQFGWSVRAMFARLSARVVVEQAAGTASGTWVRNFASTTASGGTIDATTSVGAYIEIPLTITADDSGVAYAMLAHPDTVATAAPVGISIDGAAYTTVPALATPAVKVYSGRGAGIVTVQYQPVKISGLAPGAHVIRLTHAGTAGQYLHIDCVLVQAASPEPIVYLRDQAPVAGRGASTPLGVITEARRNVYLANKALSDVELVTIFPEFPNVIPIDHNEYLDAGSLSATDGLHPNDRGNARIAEKIFRELSVRGQNADYM